MMMVRIGKNLFYECSSIVFFYDEPYHSFFKKIFFHQQAGIFSLKFANFSQNTTACTTTAALADVSKKAAINKKSALNTNGTATNLLSLKRSKTMKLSANSRRNEILIQGSKPQTVQVVRVGGLAASAAWSSPLFEPDEPTP
ncbi:hypothetical protein [Bergeriella denitrificans]|uniref:hypothetical protein n=1 Tax=Bergeriella denitrificans TaxID=494 RepID=UPI0011C04879|nr:hypothetical protein [Bergeriella denitrificans]